MAIGEFIVKGLRIIKGQRGLYVAMPQEKAKDGRWYNNFYARNPEAKESLVKIVLAAYQTLD